jgi:class 3 adenylate cyclase/tetratricopeptide (TPR) repeat protein
VETCPSCGKELPGEFPFCPFCAAPLTETPAATAEERKVVSVLFCDLVGFTAQSETADPEDVNRMLGEYFAAARTAIEAFGGVVEKFIGDAVVGVFGVPAAHEDDPERAVRAGLRIVEDAERLQAVGGEPLRLRVGVNTGEALVRLHVVPGSGEGFLAGDAVNTAARIQSAAPEMGVLVGLATYTATAQVFEFEELEPASLKGKTDAVRVFQARSPLARLGADLIRRHDSPYVGRTTDLGLLRGLFDKSVETASAQLVTVVGEPGIGKSRIVAELLAHAQDREPRLTWRQGRCLPYGDGITFWALGEIVKAHTGILETDDQETATTKLGAVLPEGPDREWLRQRLLPLVGGDASSKAEREELFTAWRTFLETVAEETPTVLVFEDIHWADEAMLAFIEHLADQVEGVPLLLVCTTRPELYDRHATFAASLHNANRINLAPLTDAETADLVARLLDTPAIPEDLREPIVERAEGNPLYVEELLRLLGDQELLVSEPDGWSLRPGAELPLPGSIQALIAARLDTLPAERKALLADAAVVGKVFWAGAVARMGDRDPAEVAEALRELSRKELVRPARRSSMAGESEYAFWHVLTRDVAYSQLPRASRATKHVAAGEWLADVAGDRAEDLADVLAHHYATALELARAAGSAEQAAELEEPARRFLTLAGHRSMSLDYAAAATFFERALALTPIGHPERANALLEFGDAAEVCQRIEEARNAIEEAVALFEERGDPVGLAQATLSLGVNLEWSGDTTRRRELTERAVALLESVPPGEDLVVALCESAINKCFEGRPDLGLRFAERAVRLTDELGVDSSYRSLALCRRGLCLAAGGDRRGVDDLREASAIGMASSGSTTGSLAHINLEAWVGRFDGPAAALEENRIGIAYAKARGITHHIDWMASGRIDWLIDLGDLDQALEGVEELERRRVGENVVGLLQTRVQRVRIATLRGRADAVEGLAAWIEEAARGLAYLQWVMDGLGAAAGVHAALGRLDEARMLVAEIEAYPDARNDSTYVAWLPALVRVAQTVGDADLAERLVADVEPKWPVSENALMTASAAIVEQAGDSETAADRYAEAASRWATFGSVPEEAFALLGQGRCLAALGKPEAVKPLLEARRLFTALGAEPALAETQALLAEQQPATS